MQLVDLRTENLREPIGVWTSEPRFSWTVAESGQFPAVCEVEMTGGDATWRSGPVDLHGTSQVAYAGPSLQSSHRYEWRVRCEVAGRWSDWFTSTFETSLLDRSDWVAPFVEPSQVPVVADGLRRNAGQWEPPSHDGPIEERLHPVKYIRQVFTLDAPVRRVRLYATAHGVYDLHVNGAPAGDQLFAPGYESYDKSLSFQVYDLTSLVGAGENVLGVRLADGWYAGRIDFTGSSAQYGDVLRAGWQIHIDYDDRTEILVPGGDVVSTTDGPIRYADIFIGERHDARRELHGWAEPGYDAAGWEPVSLVPAPTTLVPFKGEPVRRTGQLPAVRVLTTESGDTVVDFGQVIAGRVRMTVTGPRGTEVVLQHTETLDADGEFFVNINGINKEQTDTYVLAGTGGDEIWEPAFTFHGFRYVKVTGYPGTVDPANFTALVIGSDLTPTGGFECSDRALTRLHQNVVWSQRSNFLSIPTDCPQRERAGWTGDLQIFAPAATRNMDVRLFVERWLDNVRLDQHDDGLIPVIVPAPPYMESLAEDLKSDPLLSIRAAAGWGDAIAIVPWVLYQRYGDARVLEQSYAAMVAWVERQIRVAESELPARLRETVLTLVQRERQQFLWNSEPNFGDWLAPSTRGTDPSLEHMLKVAETTGEIIAAMFHFHVLQVVADTAAVLGRPDDEARYTERARLVGDAFADEYLDGTGQLWAGSQGVYVLALAFGLIPDDQHDAALATLVDLIHQAGDHLDTGFVSVPYLLDVLWNNGQRALARKILLQRTAPSWLYAVDHGATTVWEDWAAISPTGDPLPVSLNHYAFGCVDDWLYRRVAGIEPIEPGYQRVEIRPDLAGPLTWAEAWQDTPYGRITVRWERDPSEPARVTGHVDLPLGVSGLLRLPDESGETAQSIPGGQLTTFATDHSGALG